jgi:hypothetical protein
MAAQRRRKGAPQRDGGGGPIGGGGGGPIGGGGGGPIGGGGGGPIGGGAPAKLIWNELAKKYKELSDLYKKLARTPIGIGKPYGG